MKKFTKIAAWIAAAAVVGLIMAVISSTSDKSAELPGIHATDNVTPADETAARAAGEAGSGIELPLATAEHVPDGMWLVGTDIPAGTYRTMGPAKSVIPNCYWERLANASGEFDSIIANGNETGPASVTVLAGEYFAPQGCLPWALS